VGQLALASRRLAQDVLAVIAGHHSLSMTEDGRCGAAALALDVHEVAVGRLDQSSQLVSLLLVFVLWV
jgi:hypothetical protein